MYICYIDESGTPDIPGNTSHFILAGVSIPIEYWKKCDNDVECIKKRYALVNNEEIHVAWILRSYQEQNKIKNFERLSHADRRAQVNSLRTVELLRLQRNTNLAAYYQTKKNFKKTENYIHLTRLERQSFIKEIAKKISEWGFVRLFAECVDKIHFDPVRERKTIDEQSFEQVVSRFEIYLKITNKGSSHQRSGMLIHDHNQTVARKHTVLMKKFHKTGTLWTGIKHIIETPLFVNSELTSMVQIADLCAYALRRYLENDESDLFDLIFKRADRRGDATSPIVVGIRHFTKKPCPCKICAAHNHS